MKRNGNGWMKINNSQGAKYVIDEKYEVENFQIT